MVCVRVCYVACAMMDYYKRKLYEKIYNANIHICIASFAICVHVINLKLLRFLSRCNVLTFSH